MFELDQRIAEQLSTISLNSSVQVRCGNSNAFMVTASTMLPLMQMFEMGASTFQRAEVRLKSSKPSNPSVLMYRTFNSLIWSHQVFLAVRMSTIQTSTLLIARLCSNRYSCARSIFCGQQIHSAISCSLIASMPWRFTTKIACLLNICIPSSTRSDNEKFFLLFLTYRTRHHRWCCQILICTVPIWSIVARWLFTEG